jgi:hypothetical protein
LHHLVTLYLYTFSYMTNTVIGGVIAFLHNVCDIFIGITRIFSETEYRKILTGTFICALTVWFYTKLWVFPQCIYVVTYRVHVYMVSEYLPPIFCFLLSCLLVLHVYWFVLCLGILYKGLFKGIGEDTINSAYSVENKESEKKDKA